MGRVWQEDERSDKAKFIGSVQLGFIVIQGDCLWRGAESAVQ